METPMMYRDQLLTIGDLDNFKADLLREIASLIQEKNMTSIKQWLRTSEVREMLGVSSGTLQTLRVSRKLSFIRIGGIVYYKYEDVIALLEENYVPKAKPNG